MKKIFIFSIFIFTSVSAYAAQNEYLGVYEPEEKESYGEPSQAKIRLPFVWHNGEWQAMPHQIATLDELENLPSKYPSKVTLWTLQNKQKSIDINIPSAWKGYSKIGSYQVEKPLDSQLLQPTEAQEFTTWNSEFKYRPLVLTSNNPKKLAIPGHQPLNKQEKSQLLAALKIQLPHYDYCKTQEGDASKKEWQDKDVEYGKLLRFGNATLVSLNLSEKLNVCGYPEGYENDLGEITCQFCSQWFLIQDNKTKFLGAGLSYIDHGDYNSDKNDEWIFWLSGYNRDGYVLFSDNFKKKIRYTWSYH